MYIVLNCLTYGTGGVLLAYSIYASVTTGRLVTPFDISNSIRGPALAFGLILSLIFLI